MKKHLDIPRIAWYNLKRKDEINHTTHTKEETKMKKTTTYTYSTGKTEVIEYDPDVITEEDVLKIYRNFDNWMRARLENNNN